MLKGAGVSAARVVSCLLCVHSFLYVSLLPCPSFSSPPNPPFQTLTGLLRACMGTARFHHGCSSRPATNASYFSRTHAHFRTDAPRACAHLSVRMPFSCGRLLVRARAFPRAFSACARAFPRAFFCVRACFSARAFAACARAFPRASFAACARAFPRAFFLRARAPSRARLLCAYAYFTTRRAAAHTPSVRRGFVFSLNTADSYARLRTPATKLCVSTITS